MEIKKLVINLLYVDQTGKEWRFEKLMNGEGFISPEDLDFNDFFCALGGIELITENHFIFLKQCNFYDLYTGPVYFLIKSLSGLGAIDSKVFSDFIENEDQFLSYIDNLDGDDILLKCDSNQSEYLSLSYINNSKRISDDRNNFYFSDLLIDKNEWISACKIALNEYFSIVEGIYLRQKEQVDEDFFYRLFQRWINTQKHTN